MTTMNRTPSAAEPHPTASSFIAAMATAAAAWRDGLAAGQRQSALWPFASAERGNWHYAPRQRAGVALNDMDGRQRQAAYRLLESALSPAGNTKARAIMALETILGEIEGGRRHVRDPLNYAFTLFGDPGGHPWGWRVEGHHLIINATIAGPDSAVITPSFWGSNPAKIPDGPRAGERIMAKEYLLGLELRRSLTAEQQPVAVFQEHSVGNIITERGRADALARPSGLPFAELAAGQRDLLMTLVGVYVGNAADALARPYLDGLRADGLDALRLAWAGGAAEGQAFYYRIHAPRLLIEFDCTQNDANHIHSLWRDPTSDWGRDRLAEHYHHHHDQD